MNNLPNQITKYGDEDLAVFKELILKKLTTAREELDHLREQVINLNESMEGQGTDLDDNHAYTEVEFLTNMINRQKKHIQALENALIRIKNKTYGVCFVTGQLIDKRRLLAVPHATKSVDAKLRTASPTKKNDTDNEEEEEKKIQNKSKKQTKPTIITKVIRKSSKQQVVKPIIDDEDEDEYDLSQFELDEEENMIGVNLEDIKKSIADDDDDMFSDEDDALDNISNEEYDEDED